MRKIIYTSNFNGILNKNVGTTFVHFAPANYFQNIKKSETFEIHYKTKLIEFEIGIAKVIDVIYYEPAKITDTAILIGWGYPLKSFITAFKKMYPDFNIMENAIEMIVFFWNEKYIEGLSKVHTFFN